MFASLRFSTLSLIGAFIIGLLALAPSSATAASVIFSDDFESGTLDAWDVSLSGSPGWHINDTANSGSWGVRARGNTEGDATISREQSTEEYENVSLSFAYRPTGIEASDDVFVEWFDGSTWNEILHITDANSGPWLSWSGSLAGADDLSTFALRVRVDLDAVNDQFRIDDVVLVGDIISLDYGDAPAPYPTLRADDGARHGPVLSFAFGNNATQDLEEDGQPSVDADDDDTDGFDDEDGITFLTALVAGEDATVRVHANKSGGKVNGWIDWNGDGDWEDEDEQVFTDWISPNGWATTTISVPESAVAGSTYARFRINATGGLSFVGRADHGEVEDYRVTVLGEVPAPLIDFGDAPASYGTLLANDGARHVFQDLMSEYTGYNPSLGANNRDAEADGQPSVDADGDDTNGSDDENGVTFLEAFVAGEEADIRIDTNIGGGYINAWFDWNQNGVFDENEKAIDDFFDQSGWKIHTIAVPSDAVPGSTYARFRLSVHSGVGPTGEAFMGEVEDYRIAVE